MDLSSEALAALDRQDARVKRWKLANGWPTLPPFFFVTSHGKSLAQVAVRDNFRRVCRHAGLDPDRYSPKTLRHTYATLNLHDGVDVYYVSQQLGPRGANQEF